VVLIKKHRLLFDKVHFLLRGEIASELLKLLSQASADPSCSPETSAVSRTFPGEGCYIKLLIHGDKQNSSREYSF
jgi:hypothetical protein